MDIGFELGSIFALFTVILLFFAKLIALKPMLNLSKTVGFIIILFSLIICSCNPDDEMPTKVIETYAAGAYVINQGSSNLLPSVSYYVEDCAQSTDSLYLKTNGVALDSPLVDMTFLGDNRVLLLHSNKLIIANAQFEKLGEITGFTRGKNVETLNNQKAFITRYNNLGVGSGLVVVDLVNFSVIKTIHPDRSGEELLRFGSSLYVSNSGGDLVDSTITKFDATSDLALLNIEVGYRPNQMVSDKNGDIWVLCEGVIVNFVNLDDPENVPGKLVKISNDQVVLEIPLSVQTGQLSIDKNKEKLYFVNKGWTYEHPIENTTITQIPWVAQSFTASAIDPNTNRYYTSNARAFNGTGEVRVWNLATQDTIQSFEVGNIPLGFAFK